MIPIFLIPIAVLNSIHMLSSIHDKLHARKGDLDQTLRDTMGELFLPMVFTSLTTVVGFGSLIATPIPPVQVFGAFVAFGVFAAWLLSHALHSRLGEADAGRRAGRTSGAVHEGEAAPRQPSARDHERSRSGPASPLLIGLAGRDDRGRLRRDARSW